MRVLMLGWEFPPFISGGLGTACYGLTRALDDAGLRILFVLPRAVDTSMSSHVQLISPDEQTSVDTLLHLPTDAEGAEGAEGAHHFRHSEFAGAEFLGIPSPIATPYLNHPDTTDPDRIDHGAIARLTGQALSELEALQSAGVDVTEQLARFRGMQSPVDRVAELKKLRTQGPGTDYAGDIVTASQTYAHLALKLCAHADFEVIHAHDWMTYPAGMALASATGKPLVAHIHSTEFDRSGEHVNQAIYDIERRGMHAAVRVIAVSMLTKNICTARYAVPDHKIAVIYNGIEQNGNGTKPVLFGGRRIEAKDKVVLFLGRITMQKGPEYFVRAAQKVLQKMPNVKFLVAGSGDQARPMIERAAEMGIGHKVLFTGFLRGGDVKRIFAMADCYVMPSVSEPFGIAPLEAMSHGTPTIISKQSGVSEVLQNVLKVDFWDTDEMANKILAVLRHPPLSAMLREHGEMEIRQLTWSGAAEKCLDVYNEAIQCLPTVPMS